MINTPSILTSAIIIPSYMFADIGKKMIVETRNPCKHVAGKTPTHINTGTIVLDGTHDADSHNAIFQYLLNHAVDSCNINSAEVALLFHWVDHNGLNGNWLKLIVDGKKLYLTLPLKMQLDKYNKLAK